MRESHMPDLAASSTHPSSAWLISATPPALVAAMLMIAFWLLRERLVRLFSQIQNQISGRRRQMSGSQPEAALLWIPTFINPSRTLVVCAGAVTVTATTLSLTTPAPIALALAIPMTMIVIWAILTAAESRYIAQLNRDLTAAVGRLSALLKSGSGFRSAIERVVADLPTGPLRDEWRYLITRQGANLAAGGIATPQQVVAALAAQTPSARQATLLSHLSVAVGQPQDVLARRCEAAYAAIQASDRRREEAVTELAQMRYSGIAVGMAGIGMAAYLTFTQWERVVAAYSSPLGAVVGAIVIFALVLPIIGGMLLARADDVDY